RPAVAGARPPAAPAGPVLTTLEVRGADRVANLLAWAPVAGAPGYLVDRRPAGGGYVDSLAVAVAEPAWRDTAISVHATYVYRVRVPGRPGASTEVTIGPPPTGFSTVLSPTSRGTGWDRFGSQVALALDANDDPVVAWFHSDEDGNNRADDSFVYLRRWDRAAYRWRDPVRVAPVGDVSGLGARQLAVACDAATGTLGVLFRQAVRDPNPGLVLSLSRDGGVTWQAEPVSGARYETGAALAFGGGRIHAVVNRAASDTAFLLVSRPLDGGAWRSTLVPRPDGVRQTEVPAALALDGAGRPGVLVAWQPEGGSARTFHFWQPGMGASRRVLDTEGAQSDRNAVELAWRDGWHALVLASRASAPASRLHASQSMDGQAWTPAVALPQDGEDDPGLSVPAIAAGPRGVAAFHGVLESRATPACGRPKIVRLGAGGWRTCSPDASRQLALRVRHVAAAAAGDGRFYLAAPVDAGSGGGYAAGGLVLWRGE
ncbi:MAG: hypothetical protein NW201_06175, partial [Gemmatimonadales bacterium]|nr:hypothetical protein [Gemmatimonadales bacterium]